MTRRRRGGRVEGRAGSACATCEPSDGPVLPIASHENNNCEYCETKLYAGLSVRQVKELDGRLGLCRSEPRHLLFRAGDPSKYLYVVREGQVKLTRTDIDGREHLLNLVGPGYFLGFDDIGNSSYSYSAETLTPTVFCRIRHDDIVWLLKEAPQVSLNILLAVNEQLAQARNMIRALGQKTAIEKVAALLLSLYPPGAAGGSGKSGGAASVAPGDGGDSRPHRGDGQPHHGGAAAQGHYQRAPRPHRRIRARVCRRWRATLRARIFHARNPLHTGSNRRGAIGTGVRTCDCRRPSAAAPGAGGAGISRRRGDSASGSGRCGASSPSSAGSGARRPGRAGP